MPVLPTLLRSTYRLLRRTAPRADAYDVAWHGPYFIPRSGEWHPTHFLLYDHHIYATVTLGWRDHRLTWHVGTDEVRLEGGGGWTSWSDEELWRRVLEQVVRRLREAVRRPDRYNRRVERLLPLACRTGKIERRLTWPPGRRPPVAAARIAKLERRLPEAAGRSGLPELTLSRYLKTAAVALDAAFDDLEGLSALQKYRKRADTRHGGLLDVPARDGQAFAKWYRSPAWRGCHPWEIVFGHPHGILLSPLEKEGKWSFWLSVDTLGFYVEAFQMAEALAKAGVPFKFHDAPGVLAALRGADLVEVGPFYGQIGLEDLEQARPGARKLVRWDPLTPIALAGDEDTKRIEHVEKTGRPMPREETAGVPETKAE
ncbi:MAG: hypothetical protein HY721_08140 [Planctomycetes bacterium]|nr:hypothetical protein [Planctomycetota bacterium]